MISIQKNIFIIVGLLCCGANSSLLFANIHDQSNIKFRTHQGADSYYSLLHMNEQQRNDWSMIPNAQYAQDLYNYASRITYHSTNSQEKKYYEQQKENLQNALAVLSNSQTRAAYNRFLEVNGILISPTDMVYFIMPQGLSKGALVQAHFDSKNGTIRSFFINPDYPGKELPQGLYFFQVPNAPLVVGQDKGYAVQDAQGNYYYYSQNQYVPVQGSSVLLQKNPLDNPNVFEVIGTTPNDQPYGWLKVPKGGDVKRDDWVLAIRTSNGVEFVMGDPSNNDTYFSLPRGLWTWRNPVDPQYGLIRSNPDGTAYIWDDTKKTWLNRNNKRSIEADLFRTILPSNYPNKETEQLVEG